MILHAYPASCILKELWLFPASLVKRKLNLWLSGSQPGVILPYSVPPSSLSSVPPKDIWQWLEIYLGVTTGIWCIRVRGATKHPTVHSVANAPLPTKEKPKNFPPQIINTAEVEKRCSQFYYRLFPSHVIFPLSPYLTLKSLSPLVYPTVVYLHPSKNHS